MTALRFIDIGLVVASAPIVILAGLPVLGYLFGGGAWVLTRAGAAYAEQRVAAGGGAPTARLGVQVAGMMARVWLVVLAVVAARVAGDREDGIMAAVIALAAFTVYLGMTVVIRSLERNVARPS
jgi:hypothetical protein